MGKIIYDIPVFGGKILKYKVQHEGGQQESLSLREYVSRRYNVDIGLYSYGGCFEQEFNLGGKVTIGRYCSFASNIRYFGGNHPINYASTSPYFYNKSFGFEVDDIERKTLSVGHDVWCGYGVIITNGCNKIGNGAVIAAGSIVTHDIPAYAIVMGSPAKVVRYRFDQNTQEILEQSKWFNKTPDYLMKFYKLIKCPSNFAEAILKSSMQEDD